MLSEILFASVKPDNRSDRPPGLSGSGLFPCPYRLYKVEKGQVVQDEPSPQALLNMSDGWFQEEQSVKRLREAGIIIEDRDVESRRVRYGRSKIPGSIDGTVTLNGKKYLWEHKAMGTDRFYELTKWGLRNFLNYKAQVHFYMLGKGLDSCIFYAKHKDTNNYYDFEEKLDKEFIIPVIEAADKIRLEGWIPEPKKTSICSYCGFDCFGTTVDLSWITKVSAPDMVDKWKKGKQFQNIGKMLEEEARTYFLGHMGDQEVMIVDDLKVQKIVQHRFDIDKSLLVETYGPESLLKVGREKEVTMYRISEV